MVHTRILIDASGSMAGSEDEVVAASNRFMDQLGREPIDQQASLAFFEDRLQVARPFGPLGAMVPLKAGDYRPCGDTALYDAISDTVREMEPLVDGSGRERREGRGVVAIVTDGMDTCSDASVEEVRQLITEKKATGRWMFVFLSLDNGLSKHIVAELGLDQTNVISGSKGELASAMRQLTAKVKGFLPGAPAAIRV